MQRLLIPFLVMVLIPGWLKADEVQKKTLTVDIEMLSPCVMVSDGKYTGFDIELWEEIARDIGVKSDYRVTDQSGIFSDLIQGRADVGFSCITITPEREKRIDFSHHYMDSGLRILILNKEGFSLAESVKSVFSPLVLKSLGYLGLFIFICGNMVWWIERGEHFISKRYIPGIFESFWYVLVTMTTVGYGDVVPRRWAGRVMAFLIMVIGISFFGWAVAQLSSVITFQRLHSDIRSPKELRGRVVATVEGTTSVSALNRLGAIAAPAKTFEDACELLLQEQVEAVVFDSPSILYYEAHDGAGKVRAVGPIFDIQYYGFLFPEGSGLRESVNRSLLKLRENGIYDRIYNKWFSSL